MKRGGYVYILSNKWKTVLYVGVTSSLSTRILEHKEKIHPESFTAKYQCDLLIYYKGFHHIEEAIAEETRLKGLSRSKKIAIIEKLNPDWDDMFPSLEE
jgi:putative endonuclease